MKKVNGKLWSMMGDDYRLWVVGAETSNTQPAFAQKLRPGRHRTPNIEWTGDSGAGTDYDHDNSGGSWREKAAYGALSFFTSACDRHRPSGGTPELLAESHHPRDAGATHEKQAKKAFEFLAESLV